MTLVTIESISEELIHIAQYFKRTGLHINKVLRIHNHRMHIHYQETKNRFCTIDEDPNEIVVFHGTGDIKPIDIYGTTEGVDFRFSNESMWGKASDVCDDLRMVHHYAYRLPN